MAEKVADFVLKRLTEWGIRRIYAFPGDGINGFLGAFDRAGGAPAFIQPRHEEMGAFMACAHAKFTGEVGCCMATSGPGAIHLLNGLYDAKLDHQPVVAIVGQQKRLSLGTHFQQEVDLNTLFKDVSEYVQVCMEPAQARHLVDRAVRIALASRTVTTIIIPEDVQEADAVGSPPRIHGAAYSSVGYLRPRTIPREEDLRRAAEILNQGDKVAILIGQGAQKAADEVIQVAELLGAGVAKALLGKAALPDDLPFVTGSIGLLGTKPSYEMMENCDTLFMIGTNFPYSEWLPKEGQARCVQIDIDGRLLGLRYPADVPLVGDSKDTLQELIPLLQQKQDRSWRQEIEKNIGEWWNLMEHRAMLNGHRPMNPQRVMWELNAHIPDNAIITADSGSSTNWFARDLKIKRGMLASLSGNLATMGPAVPYAIGAKFAYPDRPVIAIVGDGAFEMNGMNEMLTIAKYWREWADPRLVVCVFINKDLNQVTWEQRAMAGDPKYPGSQSIPYIPAARYAELLELTGIEVTSDDDIGAGWAKALSAGRPAVLEVHTDPDTAPLPPHVRWEQFEKITQAVLKGDPDAVGIVTKTLREKLEEFVPGR